MVVGDFSVGDGLSLTRRTFAIGDGLRELRTVLEIGTSTGGSEASKRDSDTCFYFAGITFELPFSYHMKRVPSMAF